MFNYLKATRTNSISLPFFKIKSKYLVLKFSTQLAITLIEIEPETITKIKKSMSYLPNKTLFHLHLTDKYIQKT